MTDPTDLQPAGPGSGKQQPTRAGSQPEGPGSGEQQPTRAGSQPEGPGGREQRRSPSGSLGEAERSALEDQRDFLLRSLEDLEREHAAGDVDEADYAALRDDYTARAARVLRALAAGAVPQRPVRRNGQRGLVVGAAVVLFAVLAGVLVARTAGRREAGETITGDVRTSVTERLNTAGRLGSQGDYAEAIEVYDEVLEQDPDNAEALTYKGWMQFLSDDVSAGLTSLLAAGTANPRYPDVHAFLAVVLFRNGLIDEAARSLDRLDALDPPADIRQLTEGLRTQIDAVRAAPTTTAPPVVD